MRKASLLIIVMAASLSVAYAQQPPKPIADIKSAAAADPKPIAVMGPEYAAQLTAKLQESKKLEDENAQLIRAWQNYAANQKAIQSQIDILLMRAAMAAKMSIEQLDTSDTVPDGHGGYQWIPRPKPDAARAPKP